MSIEYLLNDLDKAEYLQNLSIEKATGGEPSQEEYRELRIYFLAKKDISNLLPKWVRTTRDLYAFWNFIQPKFQHYRERRAFISSEFIELLDYLETGKKSLNENSTPALPPIPESKYTEHKKVKIKIFILHGRDTETKIEVARFIEKLGLEAIILHEQANASMTSIEKIEHYSNETTYGIVLYTPCDQHEKKYPPKNRVRQNVVFEHGYLMAKLGRKNVCAFSEMRY